MTSSDPWGDQSGHFAPNGGSPQPEVDPYEYLGEESARRRRRQKTKRLLLFIGVPLLAFILISEGVNLIQRHNSISEFLAREALKEAIKQAPEILGSINNGDDPQTDPPAASSAPDPSDIAAGSGGSVSQAGSFAPPDDVAGLIATVLPSTVLVQCQISSDEWSQGSGFVLDASSLSSTAGTVIVSNWHVFKDCSTSKPVLLTSADGVEFQASVMDADVEGDLAFVDAPGIDLPALQPSMDFEQGDWVLAAGNPQGVTGTTTSGTVANYKPDSEEIFSDTLIAPGSSGGPLVNNKGEVIGVTTWTFTESTGFSISRPIISTCNLLLDCR